MATRDEIELLESINHRRFSYPMIFVDYMGSHDGAIFLNQLWFWSDKGKRDDGFVYKSRLEWQAETRLSDYAIRKATQELVDKGVLETELHKANGAPTLHYRLNKVILLDQLHHLELQNEEPPEEPDLSSSEPVLLNSTDGGFVETNATITYTDIPDPDSDVKLIKSLRDLSLPGRDSQITEPISPKPTTPTNLDDWLLLVENTKNRHAVLVRMFQALFPLKEPPNYGYIGKTARTVGGAGRLAQLLWRAAAERPTGDVLSYCVAIHKPKESRGNGTNSKPSPARAIPRGPSPTPEEWLSYPTAGELAARAGMPCM